MGDQQLLAVAGRTVLWAIWPDADSPDGLCATIVLCPDDEPRDDDVHAAVQVGSADAAWELQQLVDPESRNVA